MSVETLRSDLKRNSDNITTQIQNGAFKGEVGKHLRDTLWPFLESIVEAVIELKEDQDEQAETLDAVIQQADDLLQPDTAKELKECIGTGVALADVLDKLLDKVASGDPEYPMLKQQIQAFVMLAAQKIELIDEITIQPDDADEPEEGTDDDGADAEGDDGTDDEDAEEDADVR